jgi:4-amino-4-deoxy-L-arabinose transferase-like glycosyltransferase
MVSDERRAGRAYGWWILAGYAVLILVLLPLQSLWLDELMAVVATAGLPLHSVVTGYAAHSAGQSPLGALEQAAAADLIGYSTFAVRLPAAIAGVFTCAGVLVLARKAGLRRPSLALLIFASLPLALRYAAEARPYSQALCIAVWLTVVFLRHIQMPKLHLLAIYTLLLAIGLYTQPYVLFVAAAQTAFLALRRRWVLLVPVLAAILMAVGAYVPWYLHSRVFWRQEVNASQLHFHLQPKLAILIPRELLGSGYLGTAVVVFLSAYGLSYLRKQEADRLLWLAMIVVPLGLAIAADVFFDYFFAIRQVIFVLPPLAIASAAGLERLSQEKRGRLAVAFGALVLALNTGYAIRWFTKPRENWAAAAGDLKHSVDSGACFLAVPAESSTYYEFFEPALKGHECTATDLNQAPTVSVSISPYQVDPDAERTTEERLKSARLRLVQKIRTEQPEVRLYERY